MRTLRPGPLRWDLGLLARGSAAAAPRRGLVNDRRPYDELPGDGDRQGLGRRRRLQPTFALPGFDCPGASGLPGHEPALLQPRTDPDRAGDHGRRLVPERLLHVRPAVYLSGRPVDGRGRCRAGHLLCASAARQPLGEPHVLGLDPAAGRRPGSDRGRKHALQLVGLGVGIPRRGSVSLAVHGRAPVQGGIARIAGCPPRGITGVSALPGAGKCRPALLPALGPVAWLARELRYRGRGGFGYRLPGVGPAFWPGSSSTSWLSGRAGFACFCSFLAAWFSSSTARP